jgi:hypothetical protein
MKLKKVLKIGISLGFLLVFESKVNAQITVVASKDLIDGKPRNSIVLGGYVKLVATFDYLGLPNGSSFNMIEIPTENDVANQSLNFNAWQSRIKLKNIFRTKKKQEIFANIEGDFHGSGGGGFRLRHAYVKFNNWTVGQTSTVFSNDDVWVNISDFDGPPVGTWVRQPQIKYTLDLNKNNQFNFSIEDPVIDFRNRAVLDSTGVPTKPFLPDLVSNFRHQFNGGNFQLSGIVRMLSYKKENRREEALGYGGMISGTFKILKKDLFIYQALAGKGIERYLVGLGGYGFDAVLFEDKLETLPVYGGYLAFQHFWNSNLNSSFIYGYQEVQNKLDANYSNIFIGNYYSANLFFYPIENINLGFEFVYGDKTNYLDHKGRNHRFYFTMEYSF